MPHTIEAPFEYIEELANLEIPAVTQGKLRDLMDRNTEGKLSEDERQNLQALVELSEQLALIRGQAKVLLKSLRK
ncbi:MAG: hypothetical protein HYY18_03960 [Planctomycetes bacterium]|nr:hypothetical protein [Planctomycetota bacterium]